MDPELLKRIQQMYAQRDVTNVQPQPMQGEDPPSLMERLKGIGDFIGENTLGRALALLTADPRRPETREQYRKTLALGADFTPGLGDIKAIFHDAPELFKTGHPIWGSIALASGIPVFGAPLDFIRKGKKFRIVDSAFRLPNGEVIVAPRPEGSTGLRPHIHQLGDLNQEQLGKVMADGPPVESGFLDNEGNFLTRDDVEEVLGVRGTEEFADVEYRSGPEWEGPTAVSPDEPPNMGQLLDDLTPAFERPEVLGAFARATQEGGGATFSAAGENMWGSGKYAVAARRGDDVVVPWTGEITMQDIDKLKLTDDQAAGSWVRDWERKDLTDHGLDRPENGKVLVLDAVDAMDDRAAAIEAGKSRTQDGIFHLSDEGEYIPTPADDAPIPPSPDELFGTGLQTADEYTDLMAGGVQRQLPERPGTAEQAARARLRYDTRSAANRAARQQAFQNGLTPEELEYFRGTDKGTRAKALESYSMLPTPEAFAHAAIRGQNALGWYQGSGRAIREAFGDDAYRFTALLAAQSPQKAVDENLKIALETWGNWIEAGRPTDPAVLEGIMSPGIFPSSDLQNSIRALTASEDAVRAGDPGLLSGPKVGPFYANLLGHVDPVVNDTHMARGYGTLQSRVGTRARTLAQNAMVRNAAKEFERITGQPVTARELQEMSWTYIRGLTNSAGNNGTALQAIEQSFLEPGAKFAGGRSLQSRIDESSSIGELMGQKEYWSLLQRARANPTRSFPPIGAGVDPQSADINALRDIAERIDLNRANRPLYSMAPIAAAPAGLMGMASARQRLQGEQRNR